MQKNNFYSDNNDLVFHVTHSFPYKKFYDLMREDDKTAMGINSVKDLRETTISMAEAYGELCAEEIYPNVKQIEKEQLKIVQGEVELSKTMQENMRKIVDFGAAGLEAAAEFGGLGSPFSLAMVGCEVLNRTCPSTMLNCSWFSPIANIIANYAEQSIIDKFVPALIRGEISGYMALTEADAGSDLAALRTYGENKPMEAGVFMAVKGLFLTDIQKWGLS